jgi:hypothetical protein
MRVSVPCWEIIVSLNEMRIDCVDQSMSEKEHTSSLLNVDSVIEDLAGTPVAEIVSMKPKVGMTLFHRGYPLS